jgi:transcription-repair coupling factor (superfamily II helicase)
MPEGLLSLLQALPDYQKVLDDLEKGNRLSGLGLPRAARPLLLAGLGADLDRPILFITDRSDRAVKYLDELDFWDKDRKRLLFPEPAPLFYEQGTWGAQVRRNRIQSLTSLAVYHLPGLPKPEKSPMLITSLRAVMTRTLPRRDFLLACKVLKVPQQIKPEALHRNWFEIGYRTTDIVVEPGQYSRRGGILDVWPPAEPLPVRLDFFGNEIDSIRRFNPATQRTFQKVEQVMITPGREILPGRATARNLSLPDEEEEFYLPIVHPAPASILDYLPRNALVVIDNLDHLQAAATEIEEQAIKLRQESVLEGTLAADFPIPYISWSELQDNLDDKSWLELGRTTTQENSSLANLFTTGERFGGRLKPLINHLVEGCIKGHRMILVSRQVQRLRELWTERGYGQSLNCTPEFIEGILTEGWVLNQPDEKKYHLLTDSEIFGWERPVPRQHARQSTETPETFYADLKPGDYVVHIDYGIGRYGGLARRKMDGIDREFLCVEYNGGAQLFVPVHQADRLNRYIGPDTSPPSLTHLGTTEWAQAKQRVREEVQEVAHDLLELYAKRQVAKGHAFSVDTTWQRELDSSFPFIETEDQMLAIQEVKKDMESSRPMDRLLCGDVGYGKTEVALRAAFKAVMDGKQVALLIPTTVLAQQHYETFRQRLAPFPVEVEMLSRFRTPKEQDQIIKRVTAGSVDIVIGTHRLLQSDVIFKDLGLVIIDEEQRFGVTHKEHFKRLRTELDVLTLTATPIPRTLYMALTGVRDISTINTPPEDRLPVVTHVGPYSTHLVRQAILRELERGGQTFFVHNRVQTIRAMKQHLNKLVPEASVAIGHGQMHENELSQVMSRFSHGEVDVLLSTSIIESGLDIPNANTLIVDRGDTFGLAQLYQLRGRVGRGAQRAYAYFFRHRRRPPTLEGLERLDVIAENTQLGAGYSIAMRDLEMRGAGEMLGTRQHGYIASIGFQLYTRLLAQAVRQMRQAQGLPDITERAIREISLPISVDLPLSIGVPVEYIPDQILRLRLYRRLANMQNEAEVDAIKEEFADRFGPLPESLNNLLYQIIIKMRAESAGLASITIESGQIVLRYPPLPGGINSRDLTDIIGLRSGKNAYWMAMVEEEWQQNLLKALNNILNP